MRLTCQCCGIEQEFKDGEEAFKAAWDAPPHFTGFIVCDLCPAVTVVLGKGHTKAHALWAAEGRPEEWTFAKCCTDGDWDDPEAERKFNEGYLDFMNATKAGS